MPEDGDSEGEAKSLDPLQDAPEPEAGAARRSMLATARPAS
jgi:hypothetical protein